MSALGRGPNQQRVLAFLRMMPSGTEDIQRTCARALGLSRPYLDVSSTRGIMAGLLDAGFVERFGANGYRAVEPAGGVHDTGDTAA